MHRLLDVFEARCTELPDRLAVADHAVSLTYGALRSAAARLAASVQAGTRCRQVGIATPPSAAGAVALLAAWYSGRVAVPLNFLLSPEELRRVAADAEIDTVLAAEPLFPLVKAAGLRPEELTVAPGGSSSPERATAAADDPAVLIYTSGTVGEPKGVCLSFDNLVQNAAACIAHARISRDQSFLSVLPQFHSFGLTAMTVTPLLLGATVHYLPRFSPLGFVQAISQERIAVVMAVPSMYTAVLGLKVVTPDAFRSVELAISGGEPLPTAVHDEFRRRFGVVIYEGYGLTEAAPVVSLNTPWEARVGSVGRPIPGVNVQAVDGTGAALPAGQTGELVVRGHGVMLGYYRRPAETAAVIRDGGLWTGDIGYVDADGYVFITGRAKELIIVAGENVAPREIESVLLEHPAIAEAAVVGVRDSVRGELPVAYVILKAGQAVTEAHLREFCRGRLAGYKLPRRVHIVPDLPRTPTGKIRKQAIRPDTPSR